LDLVPDERDKRPIGLVLAGGGARGAYQLGALSELLPRLDGRPRIYVGTSIGALQAAYFAQRATDPLDDVLREGLQFWQERSLHKVISPPSAPRQIWLGARYLSRAAGLPLRLPAGFLATEPIERKLADLLGSLEDIRAHVRSGALHAAAVVATSSATGRSVVFHDGGHPRTPDDRRGIDYVPTKLTIEHVLASAAIPSAFPATRVTWPGDAGRWYVDGGTRLNAPIKPAIELGAERLVIVGLNSTRPDPDPDFKRRPDALDGAAHLTQAILADPLYNDLQTLAGLNQVVRRAGRRVGYKEIPYIFIAPATRGEIGALAQEVFRRRYTWLRGLRSGHIRLLGRLLDAGGSRDHGELMSYFFFAPEFVEKLIELGKTDARKWFRNPHDAGIWQLAPPP
jgi:NTE family protein